MTQRAPDGAAIAGLAVADVADRLMQQGKSPLHQFGEFQIALARHRADLHTLRRLADIGQALDPVEVDDVVGLHVAEIEHRHQRLPAGQEFGIVELRQQPDDLGDGLGIVIAERRWLHGSDLVGAPQCVRLLHHYFRRMN